MKIINILISISIGSACAFAGNISEKEINEIKIGSKAPADKVKSWEKIEEDETIVQYSISNEKQSATLDEFNKVVKFKEFTEEVNGTVEKPFEIIKGEVKDFLSTITYKDNFAGQTKLEVANEARSKEEASIMYEQSIEQAKSIAEKREFVKVENIISTERKDKSGTIRAYKKVTTIFLGKEDSKSSVIFFEELN